MKPNPKTFRFVSYEYSAEKSTACLRYAADEVPFEETLVFSGAPQTFSQPQLDAIHHFLYYVHLAAGISYYKAFIPEKIEVETRPMSESAARFFEDFYLKGLGEFAFKNKLDLGNKIRFPFSDSVERRALPLRLTRRTAVPIGGGKDSVVTIETLKRIAEPMVGVAVGRHKTIEEIAMVAKMPLYEIQRFLSPNLFCLNKEGALNGHVPIVGILSFIFLVAAIIYDFDTIAMSNERSANSGNLLYNGKEVNHQWSKSMEFEEKFQCLISGELTREITYFSLLRPLSEFQIAALFSKMTSYHQRFSSCNRGYKIIDANDSKWCGECDKCRFVFLALSPFLPKQKMAQIFGRDLFADMSDVDKFKELLGIEGHKPFECVGEYEESQAALYLLAKSPEWQGAPVIRELMRCATQKRMDLKDSFEKAVRMKAGRMPERYREAIDEISRLAGK
ncbi:MAG: endonuclease domain-containing protein [Pseudomonadota bacterium]